MSIYSNKAWVWKKLTLGENLQLLGLGSRISGRGFGEHQPDFLKITYLQATLPLQKPAVATISLLSITLLHLQIGRCKCNQVVWHDHAGGLGGIEMLQKGLKVLFWTFTAAYIVFECDHLGCCSGSYCEIEFGNLCRGALIYRALSMHCVMRGSGHRWRQQIIVPK